jgi:ADP-ribosylglycohydrolase
MKAVTRSTIRGMLIGGAVGDALGAPVETWDLPKILAVHGGPITRYVAPIFLKTGTAFQRPV